jgi:hypothetical protein
MKRHDPSAIAESDVVEAELIGASPPGAAHGLAKVPETSSRFPGCVITPEHHGIAVLRRLEGGEYQSVAL